MSLQSARRKRAITQAIIRKNSQFNTYSKKYVTYCDKCGMVGHHLLRLGDLSTIYNQRHFCGGYIQLSSTTTWNEYRNISPQQLEILNNEMKKTMEGLPELRHKWDQETVQQGCEWYYNDRNSIYNHQKMPLEQDLYYPEDLPSCPYCNSKWIGPKLSRKTIFGLRIPQCFRSSSHQPTMCFSCKRIINHSR